MTEPAPQPLTEEQRYNLVCKPMLTDILKRLVSVDEAIRGNGKEGLTTRVSRNEWRLRLVTWIASVCGAVIVAQVVAQIFTRLFQ